MKRESFFSFSLLFRYFCLCKFCLNALQASLTAEGKKLNLLHQAFIHSQNIFFVLTYSLCLKKQIFYIARFQGRTYSSHMHLTQAC